MKSLLALGIVSAFFFAAHRLQAQQSPPSCAPTAGLTFLCGLQNPEDVVLVPGTRWLLASGMAPGAGLNVIDTQAKTARKLFGPGTANVRADQARFASCPGPLDPGQAVLDRALELREPGPYFPRQKALTLLAKWREKLLVLFAAANSSFSPRLFDDLLRQISRDRIVVRKLHVE